MLDFQRFTTNEWMYQFGNSTVLFLNFECFLAMETMPFQDFLCFSCCSNLLVPDLLMASYRSNQVDSADILLQ